MSINTNHSNIQFEKEFLNIKKWIKKQVPGICGYSSETVQARLMQYLVSVSLPVYAETTYALVKNNTDPFPFKDRVLDFVGGTVELDTGYVSINLRQWLKGLLGFIAHWLIFFLAIIMVKKSSEGNGKATLVYDVLDGVNSDEQFVEYCRLGPITPLNSKNTLYFQHISQNKPKNHDNFYYCKQPVLEVVRSCKLGIRLRIVLLIQHVNLFFAYVIAIIRTPQLALIAKELACSSIIKELDHYDKLECIVITCSSYSRQQIWLRELINAKVHMIWYAQAWKPHVYSIDMVESHTPNMPLIRADTHWVWTSSFADYLRSIGVEKSFEVVGSIVWQHPFLENKLGSEIGITIFDSSPLLDDIAISFGHVSNYNNANNIILFLNDILNVIGDIEKLLKIKIKVTLKTKRGYQKSYDKSYFTYLDELSDSGLIFLESRYVNLYSLISSSDLIIAYPFTSPLYIADELKIKSIYYDPTSSICENTFNDKNSLISFSNSPKDLSIKMMNFIDNIVRNKFKSDDIS